MYLGCLLAAFWLYFGGLWESFGGPGGVKGRPERVPKSSKMESWRQGRSRRSWGPYLRGFREPQGPSWEAFGGLRDFRCVLLGSFHVFIISLSTIVPDLTSPCVYFPGPVLPEP